MTAYQPIQLHDKIRTWTNDGDSPPPWLQYYMVGDRAANGTFLIKTPLGSARVHRGHVAILHRSGAWCREPDEIPQLIAELEAEETPASMPIGPGKSKQFGRAGSAGKKAKRKSRRAFSYRAASGSLPSIEWVSPSALAVDPAYQRSTENVASRRLIAGIAASFDWRLCTPLVVSRRPDGSRVIIDGQHRWSAAIKRGDIQHLPCCIFTYDSPAEEARMFILANRSRKPMNRLDDFHAAITAGDEDAQEIMRLVTEAGLSVAQSVEWTLKRAGTVSFTSSISAAIRKHGPEVASAALTCLAEAFRDQPLANGAPMFSALARIFSCPPQGFDPDVLAEVLNYHDMSGWGAFVAGRIGGEARTQAMHKAILDYLNASSQQCIAS